MFTERLNRTVWWIVRFIVGAPSPPSLSPRWMVVATVRSLFASTLAPLVALLLLAALAEQLVVLWWHGLPRERDYPTIGDRPR